MRDQRKSQTPLDPRHKAEGNTERNAAPTHTPALSRQREK
jgi:hypothetical protein